MMSPIVIFAAVSLAGVLGAFAQDDKKQEKESSPVRSPRFVAQYEFSDGEQTVSYAEEGRSLYQLRKVVKDEVESYAHCRIQAAIWDMRTSTLVESYANYKI